MASYSIFNGVRTGFWLNSSFKNTDGTGAASFMVISVGTFETCPKHGPSLQIVHGISVSYETGT